MACSCNNKRKGSVTGKRVSPSRRTAGQVISRRVVPKTAKTRKDK